MTKAHQAFLKRKAKREWKSQVIVFIDEVGKLVLPSTPKEAFTEPRAHVIYDGVNIEVDKADAEFKKRYMGSWDVEPCTRQAPHICGVNGPCNGTPKWPDMDAPMDEFERYERDSLNVKDAFTEQPSRTFRIPFTEPSFNRDLSAYQFEPSLDLDAETERRLEMNHGKEK